MTTSRDKGPGDDHRILGSGASRDPAQAVSGAEEFRRRPGIAHRAGEDMAGAGRRDPRQDVRDLSLRSGFRREPAPRYLRGRSRRLRADGPGRSLLDQEQGGLDAHLPPLVPRGHLRFLRHEHRWHELARLHAVHFRPGARRRRSILWRTWGSSRIWFPISRMSLRNTR